MCILVQSIARIHRSRFEFQEDDSGEDVTNCHPCLALVTVVVSDQIDCVYAMYYFVVE